MSSSTTAMSGRSCGGRGPTPSASKSGAPAERDTAQDAISMLLAEKAREGLTVARLKWGDAFVFDSGAKEALFLHEQGIPFEVVPGVPAAIGATAYAGIPLTYPGGIGRPRAAARTRGANRRAAGRGLARARPARRRRSCATPAGGSRRRSSTRCSATALPADRAAALVYRGTLPAQQTIAGHGRRTGRARGRAQRSRPARRRRGRPRCGSTSAGSTSGRSSAAASW